jgi:dTDP-4-dehydrorhamnose reductase
MQKTRVLIIGAGGFLGSYVVQAAVDRFEVIRSDRSTADPGGIAMDITDASSVDRAFDAVKPDAVALLAAISDIDRCEAQPEQALAVNAHGAENVANACARTNSRLLFTSSGAVFDGRKHGYREEDETSPLSVYGATKVRAETVIRALVPTAVVVRLSLVLGFAKREGTNSVLDTLNAKWKAGKTVSFPIFEFRNPIDARFISKAMISLLADDHVAGIYHAGASDCRSRYELATRIAARAGIPDDLVRAEMEPKPGRAPRGRDHFLLSEKLQQVCRMALPTCDQVIERCFDVAA